MGTMTIVAQEWFGQYTNLDLATTASTLVFHAKACQEKGYIGVEKDLQPTHILHINANDPENSKKRDI